MAGTEVINWTEELKGATALLRSGLAPRDIKTAEACLFVILAGRDLGLSPVQSLRSIRPIQGRIECSADLQLGLFARNGGQFRWTLLSDTEVALELRAPWLAQPHTSRWTMEDAKRAGLAGGENWRKYPRAMLRSRAITSGLKDIGYIQGAGVYAPGEIGGGSIVDTETGEILPTSDELVSNVAQLPKPQQTGAANGASDNLEDYTYEEVLEFANQIEEAMLAKDDERAYAIYKDAAAHFSGNADPMVALRKELNSQTKTALRRIKEAEQHKLIKEGVPPLTEEETIMQVETAAINAKTLDEVDLAADFGRDIKSTEGKLRASIAIEAARQRLSES